MAYSSTYSKKVKLGNWFQENLFEEVCSKYNPYALANVSIAKVEVNSNETAGGE